MQFSKGNFYRRGRIYWVSINRDGERIQKSLHTSSKSEAERKFAQIIDRMEVGADPFVNQTLPFRLLAGRYMRLSEANKAPSTFRREKYILRNFTLHFEDTPVSRITQEEIEVFFAGEDKKPATKNRELAVLRHLLNKAKEWGEIKENPAARIKPLKAQRKPIRYLTNEEINRILAGADGIWKSIIITFLETGMRAGELARLKWQDIDFNQRIITVHGTKSYRVRHLELACHLEEALKTLPRDNERVFPFQVDWIIHRVAKICDEAGLPDVTCHIFRHTFASRLIQAGVSLRVVQELLGHQSMAMVQVYAHLAPGYMEGVMGKLQYKYE